MKKESMLKMSGIAFSMSLLLSGAYAQDVDVGDGGVPSVGSALSDTGRAVTNNVREGASTVVNAAKNVVSGGAGALSGNDSAPEAEEEPGDSAPVIMPPEFQLSGAVGKASRIGEDVLILQQDQKRLQEMKTLIDQVGIENAILMYPELASSLSNSPMVLNSQLERVKTINLLREEVARSNGPTEYELSMLDLQREKGIEVGPEGDLMSMAINDGETVTAEETVEESPALTREDVAAIIEEERQRIEAEQAASGEQPQNDSQIGYLTLSEIYGANGQMVALLTDGTSVFKVRTGDEVPENGMVTSITRDSVTMNNAGEERVIKFR